MYYAAFFNRFGHEGLSRRSNPQLRHIFFIKDHREIQEDQKYTVWKIKKRTDVFSNTYRPRPEGTRHREHVTTKYNAYNNNNGGWLLTSDYGCLVRWLTDPCCRRLFRHISVCSTPTDKKTSFFQARFMKLLLWLVL